MCATQFIKQNNPAILVKLNMEWLVWWNSCLLCFLCCIYLHVFSILPPSLSILNILVGW